MQYRGFVILDLDEYRSDLPAEVRNRSADLTKENLVLVFDCGYFVGNFPCLESAKGFLDGLISRQVSAADFRAEYARFRDALEYQIRFDLIGAFNLIRDIENEVEDLDPSGTPGPG